jgi:hypothetical protein
MKHWKMLGLTALITAVITPSGLFAYPDAPKPTEAEQIANLTKELKDLRKRVEEFQALQGMGNQTTALQFQLLEKRLDSLEQGLAKLSNPPRVSSSFTPDTSALQFQLLEKRVDSLEQGFARLANPPRVSASFTPDTAAQTGTIRLRNQSNHVVTVSINGVPIQVQPNEMRLLENQAVGTYSFLLSAPGFGVFQSFLNRALSPREVYTINIQPTRLVPEAL